MSGLPPLPGHPDGVRLLADRLGDGARRLSAIAGVLSRLRTGATWDGPAGAAFGARLHEVTPVLDAVSARLAGSVAPLRALADALEEAQAVVGRAVLDLDEAEHAYAALEERVVGALTAGATEAAPHVVVLRHLQVGQVEAQQQARSRHAAAAERFREADSRCAALLRSLSVDSLADSLPYRVLAGVGSAAHDIGTVGPAAAVVPELRPVLAVADGIGVGADAALLLLYGEGDAGQLAVSAGLAATGVAGGVLRAGATAGAERTAAGVVSTTRLTVQQRLALGAVREARARRDALRAATRVAPPRGTPSALLGGPAPRSLPPPGWWRAGPMSTRLANGARRAVGDGRALARERVDRAFLDDWRLATANGPQAQRMYAAGTTLELASGRPPRAGTDDAEQGGGRVR